MSIRYFAAKPSSLVQVGLFVILGSCRPTQEPAVDPLTRAYPDGLCTYCDEWIVAADPFKVFGNTYYVGTEGLASVLITSADGHVLIDGGLPNSAPLIEANIRALGFDVEDVEVILNSHAHFDHAGGLAALQRTSGARVLASPASRLSIRNGKSRPDDPQHGTLLDFPSADVEEIRAGDTVKVGSVSIVPHSTPAHTPGGTSWSWESCEADSCLQLVYADSQTPISADGFLYGDRADLNEVEEGYATLESLACDILITPHPSASSFWERREGAAGLVDVEACERYAATARESLSRRLTNELSR